MLKKYYPQKQIKTLMMLFVTLSISSCINPPKKPVGHIAGINARPTDSPTPYMLQFDLENDFDKDLKRIPGHDGVRVPITLDSLHTYWCEDTPSKEELVRYALDWKSRIEALKKRLDRCENGYPEP